MDESLANDHLNCLRRHEIEQVRAWLAPGKKVLEVGGANGFQASCMAAWGCHVTSVDIAERPREARSYYPVLDYDGEHLPFEAHSFDIVFSSNVLEHIPNLPGFLGELARVLRPGGLAIHVLPSSGWRVWTLAAHYLHLLRRLYRHFLPGQEQPPISGGDPPTPLATRMGLARLRRAVFPGPHGEYPNALAEIFAYRTGRWKAVFETHGFQVSQVCPGGLFYTGYALWPALSLAWRKRLSTLLGTVNKLVLQLLG
jgi:SAM-dependent methyltransferase